MEELNKIKEQISKNIKLNTKVAEEIVDEIIEKTFEKVSNKDSVLDVSALSYNVRKRIEKENNVEDKTYQEVDKAFGKQIYKYKNDLVKLGIIRESLNIDDDFENIYNEAKDNLKNTKESLKEFLSIRDKIIEIVNNSEISEEERQDSITKLQEDAKYHNIEDKKELEKMELLYTTNESLIELLRLNDIPDDEKNERYEEYNNTVRKLIKENYNEKIQELVSVSRDIDYILSDKAQEKIMDQASKLYKEIGWTKNENEFSDKQILEMSCFTDEYFVSQDEYIEKMIEFELKENTDIKDIKEEIEKLGEQILDIEEDSELLDDEKSKKLEELNNDKSEKEESLEDKIKELKDDYGNRYDKIIELFNKMKKFSDSRSKFYDKERSDLKKSLTSQILNNSNKDFKEISSRINIGKGKNEKLKKEDKKEGSKEERSNKGDSDNKKDNTNVNPKNQNTSRSDNSGVVYITQQDVSKSSVPAVISNACDAKNTINEFLNMTSDEQEKFIDKSGFDAIKKAITILSNNNEGYSLSRSQRTNLTKAINNNAILKFNMRNINSKKANIIEALNVVDPLIRENTRLFNVLYGYNGENSLPNIINGKINKTELFRINRMLNNYRYMIENGELSKEQISMIDNYLISPLNICITKNEISNMGVLGKFKSMVSRKNERLNNINSSINSINFAKINTKNNIGNSLKNSINTEPSVNRTTIDRESKQISKTSQNIPGRM